MNPVVIIITLNLLYKKFYFAKKGHTSTGFFVEEEVDASRYT